MLMASFCRIKHSEDTEQRSLNYNQFMGFRHRICVCSVHVNKFGKMKASSKVVEAEELNPSSIQKKNQPVIYF